jgi:hypothetical protein
LTRFLEPFSALKAVDKKLRFGILFFLSFLIFSLFAQFPITLYFLIESQDFYDFERFFDFHNFLLIIAITAIYLTLKNSQSLPLNEKEALCFRNISTIFLLYYILDFYVISKIIEFRPATIKSLPSTLEDLLPIDWYTIESVFNSILENTYYEYDDLLGLAFALIAAISIALAIIFFALVWNAKREHLSFKFDLTSVSREFKSTNAKFLVIAVLVPFLFFGNARIQESDFSSLSTTVEFIQDDLVEFQGKLPKETELSASETIERRRTAAQSVYNDLISKEKWVSNEAISLWSPDVKELRVEVIEWIALWKAVLKELSLNGYTEKESIFELQQKYKEISKFAIDRAPKFTEEYTLDFWRDEFASLVR